MAKGKKGQHKMSFGMIFSIIMIILFVSFAVWGITKLVGTGEDLQIKQFVEDLQEDVEELQNSAPGQEEFTYSLPSKVKEICFTKETQKNLKIIKEEDGRNLRERYNIEKIDLEKIIKEGNEYCVQNKGNEIKLMLKREEGENKITIKRLNE